MSRVITLEKFIMKAEEAEFKPNRSPEGIKRFLKEIEKKMSSKNKQVVAVDGLIEAEEYTLRKNIMDNISEALTGNKTDYLHHYFVYKKSTQDVTFFLIINAKGMGNPKVSKNMVLLDQVTGKQYSVISNYFDSKPKLYDFTLGTSELSTNIAISICILELEERTELV